MYELGYSRKVNNVWCWIRSEKFTQDKSDVVQLSEKEPF